MSRLDDVNTTDIAAAIRFGCRTMQNVFNADDNDVPFFSSCVRPTASFSFSAWHSEAHVPGRHLNALLNAEDAVGVEIDEGAIEKHRRAAFFSYGGPLPLALNRETVDGGLCNFSPHNLREGFHALYALVKYRDDAAARELAERSIATILDLWNPVDSWDVSRLTDAGLKYNPGSDFISGSARMNGR